MTSIVGTSALVLALAAAVVGMAVAGAGLVTGRRSFIDDAGVYPWLVLGGASVASATLVHAFLTHDFAIAYVVENNSRQTPLLYDISGMWSALQGSILLWGLVLAGYVAAFSRRLRRWDADPRTAWARIVALGVVAFFFAMMVFAADPFVRTAGSVPANGNGPNALLQNNLLVAFHPPLMYLGLVGFTIPFAMSVAELVTLRTDTRWLAEQRRWALFAWVFLSAGIVLGMWWSYQVLGWAGYWGWDPVENGPLIVWLASTAYLHSVLAQQRRRLLRIWNLSLLLAAFTATIFTTFLTRSDVVESVHAFSQSQLGGVLLGFLLVVALGGVGLIAWRGDRLRTPGSIDSAFSREGAFLANNALFAAFGFTVVLGTIFPVLLQAVNGARVTVGAPFFDSWAAPFGLALVLLMAIGPALPWRRASMAMLWHRLRWPAWGAAGAVVILVITGARGIVPLVAFTAGAFAAISALRSIALAVRRHRWRGLLSRETGGMVVHLGVVLVVVAITASSAYGQRGSAQLAPARSARVAGVEVTYLGMRFVRYADHSAEVASIRLGGSSARYHPAISSFGNTVEGVGTPAVISGPLRNVYLTVDDTPTHPGGPADIGVVVQPLMVWLWVGGLVMAIGALLAMVAPDRRRPARRRQLPPVAATADDPEGLGVATDPDLLVSPGARLLASTSARGAPPGGHGPAQETAVTTPGDQP